MIPFNALTVLVRQQEGYLQIKIQIQNDLLEMQQVCIQSDMKIHLWNSSVIGDPTLVYAEYTFTHSWVEIFFLKFYSNHTVAFGHQAGHTMVLKKCVGKTVT